jgi:hypothetical protein
VPLRGDLEPRERVDRDGVGLDAPDVAVGQGRRVAGEQRADAPAEARKVASRDRASNRELEGLHGP